MASHSAAAYNAGMDDPQTLTTIPSGPGRSPADEPRQRRCGARRRTSPRRRRPHCRRSFRHPRRRRRQSPRHSRRRRSYRCPGWSSPAARPSPMTYAQLRRYDGRLEVWDAESETAWMVREPTSPTHESPSHGLAGLVERIAAVRGSSIKCYGSMDLLMRDAQGEPRRIMQADQTVYLYPRRAELLGRECDGGGAAQLSGRGAGGGPHDGRSAGEAEAVRVVGVPGGVGGGAGAPGGEPSAGPCAGLTIHLLEDGVYRESPESLAFPGWRAEAIHEAMNEAERSVRTNEILEGLGRRLGSREGTGPDDDALMRSLRGQSRRKARQKARWRAGRKARRRAGRRGWQRAGGKDERKAWRKARREVRPGWSARCCCRGTSRCRKGSRPTSPGSANHRRPPLPRRRSPVTVSRISTPASGRARPRRRPHDGRIGSSFDENAFRVMDCTQSP